jgi:hypothetical protein
MAAISKISAELELRAGAFTRSSAAHLQMRL